MPRDVTLHTRLIVNSMRLSYDYGAAIKETRLLWEKYDEMKRQSLFIRSSPQFRKTDWIGDTNSGIPGVSLAGPDAFVAYLRNPDSGTGFVIVRQANSSSTCVVYSPIPYYGAHFPSVSHRDKITFSVTVPSRHGQLSLPQTFSAIELNGRQSKVLITDYSFGQRGTVLHTTASIFFAGTIGARDVLFISGDPDQSHEISLILSGRGGKRTKDAHVHFAPTQSLSSSVAGATTVTFRAGITPGLVTVWDSDEQLILFSDPVTAVTFWSPPIRSQTSNTIPGLETFWQFGTNTTVLVGGPYLVRNATLDHGTLALRGDLNASVPLTIIGPERVSSVTWNGQRVSVRDDGRGVLTGRLAQSPKVKEVKVPKLSGWKYADSLPEIRADFDDSDWVVADHTSTNITIGMAFGDGRVLYGACLVILAEAHLTGPGFFIGCDYGL